MLSPKGANLVIDLLLMKTTLAPHTLSARMHFGIILRRRLQSLWYVYLIFFGVGVYFLFLDQNPDQMGRFLGVVGMVYPFSTVLSAWVYTRRQSASHFYQEREIMLRGDVMEVRFGEEEFNSHTLKTFIKAEQYTNYWLLYMNKTQYYIIPRSAFDSDETEAQFAEHLEKYTDVKRRSAGR